ncbi:VOC family protein [Proteinivorax hydrogeniformans]|uniref:VOC family protein n=1 Tax=Proteinivorax hydrogeniformans TaxID=1826727 RepID=A0AAU8HVR2_9FIRM
MVTNWTGMVAFYGTDDLEKTHKFYHELLGLNLYKDQGLCKIYSVREGGKIGFCSHLEVLTKEKSPIITLLTDDVDKVYKSLINSGLDVPKPKVNPKFNIYHFFTKDPNGYSLEIQKFLD